MVDMDVSYVTDEFIRQMGRGETNPTRAHRLAQAMTMDAATSAAVAEFSAISRGANVERDMMTWLEQMYNLQVEPCTLNIMSQKWNSQRMCHEDVAEPVFAISPHQWLWGLCHAGEKQFVRTMLGRDGTVEDVERAALEFWEMAVQQPWGAGHVALKDMQNFDLERLSSCTYFFACLSVC